MRFRAVLAWAWQLPATLAANPDPSRRVLTGFDPSLVKPVKASDDLPEFQYLKKINHAVPYEALKSAPPFVPASPPLEQRYIDGEDDRYLYANDTTYPFSTVGKLYWSDGVWCSGSLIGPRHVLTAKHCLSENATGTFAPGFDKEPRLGSAEVRQVITTNIEWGDPCGWKYDWAILILASPLGSTLGYLGVEMPEKRLVDKPLFDHMGYPGDLDNGKRPYRVNASTIQSFREWDCDAGGPFYTDTDCAGGQSGGPIWLNKPEGSYAWGTLSVTFASGDTAWSGWGCGYDLVHTVNDLRQRYP